MALLVPFREDFSKRRTGQLFRLLRHLDAVFLPELPEGYRAKILVLEQSSYGPFNKGKLLNVGARWCKRYLSEPVLLVLQDVDMLPHPAVMPFYCHCRRGDVVHPGWINRKYDYEDYFGSVCTVTLADYLASGGFPNEFWGWGLEDDCVYWRLQFCAGCRVFKPDAADGLEHLDDPILWKDGPGVEHNRLEKLESDHMLAAHDTILDPPDFRVLHVGEAGCLQHLLLELRSQGPPLAVAASGAAALRSGSVLRWLAGAAGRGLGHFEACD